MDEPTRSADLFDQAFAAHSRGALDEAERGYKATLHLTPDHANALRLLGLVHFQNGQHDQALNTLKRAVALAPHDTVALCDLAHVQRGCGLLTEALQTIKTAEHLAPDSTLVLTRHGMILTAQGQPEQAEQVLRRAQDLDPDNPDIQFHLGCTLLSGQKHTEAAVCFMAVINQQPMNAAAWSHCGTALTHLRQSAQALDCFNHALEITPDHKPYLSQRAALLARMGNFARALADMNKLIALSPQNAEALYNRGTLLAKLEMFERAIQDFKRALDLSPEALDIRANYARALIELGMYDEACDILKEGLRLAQNYGEFHSLLGAAFNGYGKLQESLRHLQRAYVYGPDSVDTLHTLGLTLDDLGRPHDALDMYDEALKQSPDNPDILLCRSLSQMMLGNFAAAWPDFRARTRRMRHAVAIRHKELKLWAGENLGKTSLIIHAEQGYGDTLQFCRFIPLARRRTRHIVVEAPKPLLRLLETIPGIDMVTDNATGINGVQCPLPDLPLALGLDQDTVAPVAAYVKPPPAVAAKWAERLTDQQGQKIGIAWQGRVETRRAPHLTRGVPLADLLAALPRDARIYPLQKDISQDDASLLDRDSRVQNLTDSIEDFADSAAIAEAMDVIVTIDTAPAHLALALAKPTCVLLPFAADWRWMQDATSTPWYPSATLYRQQTPGDWVAPLACLPQDLEQK